MAAKDEFVATVVTSACHPIAFLNKIKSFQLVNCILGPSLEHGDVLSNSHRNCKNAFTA